VIPGLRTLGALALWTLLGAVVALVPAFETAWWGSGGLILGLLFVDGVLGWRVPAPTVDREVPTAISMQARSTVLLRLENRGRRRLRVEVYDHVPAEIETDELPISANLAPAEEAELRYRVRPVSRGPATFGPVEMRVRSPLGFFDRIRRVEVETVVRVYPNFEAVRRYQILATEHRTSQLGIRRRPRRGAGLDFHQLREYRAGDPLRQVDWKATSRFQRAISREYQDERDQQVVVVLDCGRRMRAHDGPLSHMDAALDAALLVANVALRQGDAVGFATLGGTDRWLAPRKGTSQLSALLDGLYDLHPQPRASDHLSAATELMGRVHKRSLILWLSNLRDEDGGEMGAAMRLLARRHLVLLASLRETVLDECLERPVADTADAIRAASIHQYLLERRRTATGYTPRGAASRPRQRLSRSQVCWASLAGSEAPGGLANHVLILGGRGLQ
jgi:uncharacterized protein (DUF58 family)